MKTILVLVLLFASVNVFAKTSRKSEVHFNHSSHAGLFAGKDAALLRVNRLTGKRELRSNGCRRMWFGFTSGMQQHSAVKLPLTQMHKQRGPVGEALSHVYVKNGAAGFMGGWVNNVQLTFGWRYQPFRVLGTELPVPVHPLLMRVRVRI
ncbi:MAG: hypothetical protein IM638_14820 [Bacteroidetes bacterium]|nr:hypothetical protein [Bacteroidota bacterium]